MPGFISQPRDSFNESKYSLAARPRYIRTWNKRDVLFISLRGCPACAVAVMITFQPSLTAARARLEKEPNAALIPPQPPGMQRHDECFFFLSFHFFPFLQKDKLHTFPPRRGKNTLQWQSGGAGGALSPKTHCTIRPLSASSGQEEVASYGIQTWRRWRGGGGGIYSCNQALQ